MAELARWTTPSLSFKPSAEEIANIVNVALVIKQDAKVILEKDQTEAEISDGMFIWNFSQEETSLLKAYKDSTVKIDYTTISGMRYTTRDVTYNILDSGKQEVL